MTPPPAATMWRAAARAVTKLLRSPVSTGRARSSTRMSSRGWPCTSPRVIRLKETSIEPADAATASAWATTASSSTASRTATSAVPPAAAMSPATASSGPRVRPTRWTVAPSRANVRATPPPSEPPAP